MTSTIAPPPPLSRQSSTKSIDDIFEPVLLGTTDVIPTDAEPVILPLSGNIPGTPSRSRASSIDNDETVTVVTRRIDDATSKHRRVLSDRPHLWHLVGEGASLFETEKSKFIDLEADYSHLHVIEDALKKRLVSTATEDDYVDTLEPTTAIANAVATAAHNTKKNRLIVVIPSVDPRDFKSPRIIEERQLWNLLLLDDPLKSILFLASTPFPPQVVSYYLTLSKAGDDLAEIESKDLIMFEKFQRMQRLHMLSPQDDSPEQSLSDKIISRPNLLSRMADVLENVRMGNATAGSIATLPSLALPSFTASDHAAFDHQHAAGVTMFTGTPETEKIANTLNLRMLEAGTEALHWGTKQGCRELFHSCGIPMAAGTPDPTVGDYADLLEFGGASSNEMVETDEDNRWAENIRYIRTPRNLAIGIARQIISKNIRPNMWMVKLNVSSGGRGNAHLNLKKLKPDFSKVHFDYEDTSRSPMMAIVDVMANEIETYFPKMRFEDPEMTWEAFTVRMLQVGAIGEAYLEGSIITSPSVQAVVEPRGGADGDTARVTVLSTHEQILHGQVYFGCKNPAFHSYRGQLVEYGRRLGYELAKHGVVGHFGADFLAAGDNTLTSELYAIEINLRQSGTTHPYRFASLLTRGHMDEDGILRSFDGRPLSYVATDKFKHDDLIGVTDTELIKAVRDESDPDAVAINWNPSTMVGSVFHVFHRLETKGMVGFTSIGGSDEEAQEIYDATVEFIKKIKNKRT